MTVSKIPLIQLKKITKKTLRSILALKVTPSQSKFVAPNTYSIAEAHFEEKAWFRAIYAEEEPVGFLMLYEDPETPEYYLWRFMIDAKHQGKGYGSRAIELLVEYVKTRPNANKLFLTHVKGESDPSGFYQKLGFAYTGKEVDGELEMVLLLD